MEYAKKNDRELDKGTKQYIKRLRLLQVVVLVSMCLSFIIFAQRVVKSNRESLQAVALEEVQESMRETVNNLAIRIDTVRNRQRKEADVLITDTIKRIETMESAGVKDISLAMGVCKENKLGLKLQALYQAAEENYHVRTLDKTPIVVATAKGEELYQDAIYKTLELEGGMLTIFIKLSDIDKLVKEEIREYVHAESYEGNQYVWVNEVLNMDGGDNYAIRRIHPNLKESEGEYLSTSIQDSVGNYPYLTELEGIRRDGYVFHSYYFKNIMNDEIMEKFSYSQYYEPYGWIISTGETLEEVYEYSADMNEQNMRQIITLMVLFIVLFVAAFGIMISFLGKQAKTFRGTLLKQNEILEDIYSTMSVGLLRIRMTEEESTTIKINPKGLELFGVETEEEFKARREYHIVDTINEIDGEKMVAACKELKEQWESVVVECRVKWKDGSTHLLRIRNTLVDFDDDAKIIQRMCQDITEERRQQEEALYQAEEKATLDPMTQIKNKKAIELITKSRLKEAEEKKLPIAVGFVDIDNFRDYNTKYGHLQGDEVIKYVATTLKETIKGDVGRTGGDEFTFCMLDTTYEEVEAAMKHMHEKLNYGVIVQQSGELIPTPCSIGVVIQQGGNLEYDYILKQSDEAMYQAKERGKNTYHILQNMLKE